MFFCDKCAKKLNWPKGACKSYGNCEVCKETSDCSDIPSSFLLDMPEDPSQMTEEKPYRVCLICNLQACVCAQMTEEEMIDINQVDQLGMPMDRITYKSSIAHVACGTDWATLYDIMSKEQGKGHATELLRQAKAHYEASGKTFGGTVALNDRMKQIYQRLGITEFE